MSYSKWRCKYCSNNRNSPSFNLSDFNGTCQWLSQEDFVKHLMSSHLKIGFSHNQKTYECSYGPTGVCNAGGSNSESSSSSASLFYRKEDYEHHIVQFHLSASSRKMRETSIVELPSTVRNYQEVKEEQRNHSRINTCGSTDASNDKQNANSPPHWTVYHSSVNLAALLNDPKHRQMDIFSRTWGDAFERAEVQPSPYLPPVSRRHFEKYIQRVSARFIHHASSLKNSNASSPSSPPGAFPMMDGETMVVSRNGSSSTNESLHAHSVLEMIPKMFFQTSFNLESPSVFNAIIPYNHNPSLFYQRPEPSSNSFSSVSPSPTCTSPGRTASSKCAPSYQALHDKLSHYLDIVEVHIARQVSRKSSSFFEAVRSHDIVRDRLTQTLDQIQKIRQIMRTLDEQFVVNHVKVLRLSRQRSNYQTLFKKLRLIMTVHSAQPTIQTLLKTNDFCGALDLIATTQDLIHHELAGLQCFRHLDAQLTEMAKFVDMMVQSEFVQVVQQHLECGVEQSSEQDSENQLISCMMGMLRIKHLQFVEIYHNESSSRVKDVVRSTLLESVKHLSGGASGPVGTAVSPEQLTTNENAPQTSNLANQMRQLNYEEWVELLDNICTGLSNVLLRINLGCEVMCQSVKRFVQSDASDIGLESAVTDDLIDKLNKMPEDLARIAQERLVKVLNARARDGFMDKLNSPQFVRIVFITNQFLNNLQEFGCTDTSTLRSAVNNLSVRFIDKFHKERRNKLTLILENERWRPAEVPPQIQELAKHFQELQGRGSGEESSFCQLLDSVTSTPSSDSAAQPSSPVLILGEKRFIVAGTVLLLFNMLLEYCQCARDLHKSSTEVLARIVDLLKFFNSQTCQLVLGAGAIKLLGIKTITTRNLALASSSLQVVLSLLPYIRRHFAQLLTADNIPTITADCSTIEDEGRGDHFIPSNNVSIASTKSLKHLDQADKLYREHVNEISTKLVDIIDSMIVNYLINWYAKPPVPSPEMKNVCTQMLRFHEAIEEILPQEQTRELFLRIHNKFKLHLRAKLSDQNVCNDNGPKHVLVMSELAFYKKQLQNVKSLKFFNDEFEDLWSPLSNDSTSTANHVTHTSSYFVPPLDNSLNNNSPSPTNQISE